MENVLNTRDLDAIQSAVIKINELDAQRQLLVQKQKDIQEGKTTTDQATDAAAAVEKEETCN